METPVMNPQSPSLSQSSSGRRSGGFPPTSPEFEFWMVRNPSFPQPNLLSADELFVDGVLLPLHLLSHHNDGPSESSTDPNPKSDAEPPINDLEPDPRDGAKLMPNATESSSLSLTSSKRWNIFRKGEKKNAASSNQEEKEKEREKKKEKKTGNGATSAELNINIWPFSRSRSAGNAIARPKMFPGGPGSRKVNSAPCSRSNSAGESKSRKWPSSPSRAGVHLGRSSPVWQVRRGGSAAKTFEPLTRNAEKIPRKEPADAHRSKAAAASSASRVRVLNLNVPMCIGYRNHLSCRSDETSAVGVVSNGNGGSGGGGGGSHGYDNNGDGGGSVSNPGNSSSSANLFSIRSLFTKKVH